jgi:hypothetical protein
VTDTRNEDGQLTVDDSTDRTARAEDEGRTAREWVRRLDENCQCRSPIGTTSQNILQSCLYTLTDQPAESWKDFPEPENEEVVTEYRALQRAVLKDKKNEGSTPHTTHHTHTHYTPHTLTKEGLQHVGGRSERMCMHACVRCMKIKI